jgi:nucleoside-diphosphate-sugar epimerase
VAHEVPCPIARFRVDAAGWAEHDWRLGADPASHASIFAAERAGDAHRAPRTVVVECKASRADFLRDDLRVDDLLAERERLLGRKAEIDFQPLQPGDVLETYADISAIADELGFAPSTPIEVGIPDFVDWYRAYRGRPT